MKPPPAHPYLLLLLLLLLFLATTLTTSTTITPANDTAAPSSSTSTLDPKQLRALQSLNIPTSRDPCIQPSPHNATICDTSKPFRHLISLHLSNCSTDLTLSLTALKSLSSLHSLSFSDCHATTVHFPSNLALSLTSFSSIRSLRHLSGVFLSHLRNLTDLTVSSTPVNTSGLHVIIGNMNKLQTLTISNSNLTGFLPRHLHSNLTHIDLSNNDLKGHIPISITLLEDLESLNLSSNHLTGEIPTELGDLISLKNLNLSSNSFSGSIPDSISSIPGLTHVDLSKNQLNGTLPEFFSKMKELKILNLENNELHGVLPFNASFIKKLEVFKIGGNQNLCYNHSVLGSSLKLGIGRCDKHGLPVSPPTAKEETSGGEESDDYDNSEDDTGKKEKKHEGPSKVVLGVAIGLSSLVFLIVFLILISKWCR